MKWLIFFLMFPHLKPACLEYLWPTVDAIFNAGRVVSALFILFLYLLKKKLPSKPVWILTALQMWLLFVTFLQARENIRGASISLASILAVALLIDFFSGNIKSLLNALLLNLEIVIYANLASVLLYYPEGMYDPHNRGIVSSAYYFLGNYNSFIMYVLPAIVIAILYIRIYGKHIRPLTLIIAGCLQIIITWSATSICGLLAFAIILLLCKTSAKKVITYPNIFVSTLAFDLLISVFRVMDRVFLVALIIESFLHKKVTLTGRTLLWDSFYQRFFDSPWIGYGKGTESAIGTGLSAHNQWFQFLLEGGVIGLLLFLIFNIAIGKVLMKGDSTSISSLFYAFFSAMYVCFIADVYLSNPWLYIPLILAYHIDKLEAATKPVVHRSKQAKRGYYVPNRKLPEEH